MRRLIISLAILSMALISAAAQPRAAGVRLGGTGIDATYQHYMARDQFIEGNLGLDFGYNMNGRVGVKATATYNLIWARPAWTDTGSWALYAGPGVSIGGVNDMAVAKFGDERVPYNDGGFMLAAAVQVGLEYCFDFPLQISVDLRPYFGFHVNDGKYYDILTQQTQHYGRTIGFYDSGLLGFVPSISVRYIF